jgi:hypothetical protein
MKPYLGAIETILRARLDEREFGILTWLKFDEKIFPELVGKQFPESARIKINVYEPAWYMKTGEEDEWAWLSVRDLP